jgi:predicted transcriptional regulator
MRTLTLCYKKYGKEILLNSLKEAMGGQGQNEDDVIYFNDIATMYKFLSPARTELLSFIKNEKPASIYDLAQKLNKDQGYISKEIKYLNELGVIDLIPDESSGRQKLIPILNFDRVIFDIGIDEFNFSKVASE